MTLLSSELTWPVLPPDMFEPARLRLLDALSQFCSALSFRSGRSRVELELFSGYTLSYVRIRSSPPVTDAEFAEQVVPWAPAIFFRDSVHYISAIKQKWTFAVAAEDGSGFPKMREQPNIDLPQAITASEPGDLFITGLSARDVADWSAISELALYQNTVIGSRRCRISELALRHVGPAMVIKARPEIEWASANIGPTVIKFNSPLSIEKHTPALGALRIELVIADDATLRELRFHTPTTVICDRERQLSEVHRLIRRSLPPRLHRKFGFFLSVEIPDSPFIRFARQLPANAEESLTLTVGEAITELGQTPAFKTWVQDALTRTIASEARQLQQRKLRVRISRKVTLGAGTKSIPLYREPQNEQDVVLLMAMLAHHKVFPTFEFLEYDTARGIDAIARVQLLPINAVDDDAIVEFKHKLEGFLNDLHPLSLVDLIVAWDGDVAAFANSDYQLTFPYNNCWLGRLMCHRDGSTADVLLLRHVPGVRLLS